MITKLPEELDIQQKDFLETKEGLIFAVVSDQIEEGRSLAFLRYKASESSDTNKWNKLPTEQANELLSNSHPQYLFHSNVFDADLHAVAFIDIEKHHKPVNKLQDIFNDDSGEQRPILHTKLVQLLKLFIENRLPIDNIGVTGSILIGAEGDKSDIDLVIYDRQVFNKARKVIQQLITKKQLSELNSEFWKDSYDRRSCSLTYDEYVWHEKRKFNKAVFQGVKFDISLVLRAEHSDNRVYTKRALIHMTTRVIDDQYSFDSPSIYIVDNDEFKSIICFTPTYTGQAKNGDLIEVAGFLEESTDGTCRRVIVGSSREASGEFIKVVG